MMITKVELEDILSYFKEFVVDKYRLADIMKQQGHCKNIAVQLTEDTIEGINHIIDIIEKEYKIK